MMHDINSVRIWLRSSNVLFTHNLWLTGSCGGDDDQSDHEDRDGHQSEHSDQDQVDNEGRKQDQGIRVDLNVYIKFKM